MDTTAVIFIWLHLLLPTHWPILVAGLGTALYSRKLRNKGMFFVVSWVSGYGMQGLASVPWPLMWLAYFGKQGVPREYAIFYVYSQAVVSALLTLWVMHIIATKYWHRLYP